MKSDLAEEAVNGVNAGAGGENIAVEDMDEVWRWEERGPSRIAPRRRRREASPERTRSERTIESSASVMVGSGVDDGRGGRELKVTGISVAVADGGRGKSCAVRTPCAAERAASDYVSAISLSESTPSAFVWRPILTRALCCQTPRYFQAFLSVLKTS